MSKDSVDPWLYDRNAGQGEFARAVVEVRAAQYGSSSPVDHQDKNIQQVNDKLNKRRRQLDKLLKHRPTSSLIYKRRRQVKELQRKLVELVRDDLNRNKSEQVELFLSEQVELFASFINGRRLTRPEQLALFAIILGPSSSHERDDE